MAIRFVFALHNHQPVGNFDSVFETAYRDSYQPFLQVIEEFGDVPVSLHTSGPLLEWLQQHKPDYVDRLRRLVARGQVEILGGAFYEPILPMIPARDRVGQIASFKQHLENTFQTRVRGMWIAERVWEQALVQDIAAAGVEYTILDDYHFKQAGLEEGRLFGHHVTEDEGRLLSVFPVSERVRLLLPYCDPQEAIRYIGEVAGRHPDGVVVFADDGEKFGAWPGSHAHCYQHGWLRRFLEALRHNRQWIRLATFAQALDETPSWGKVYLPDCSYREMTEWALPTPRLTAYEHLKDALQHDGRANEIRRFLRGGYWRNFQVKYPETEEMYARMIEVSNQIQNADPLSVVRGPLPDESCLSLQRTTDHGPRTESTDHGPRTVLEKARTELYKAQCNCPWWHGTFGGLYLPHLRNAVYRHLIAAENHLLDLEGKGDDWIDHHTGDLNLDGAPEVKLGNRRLAAYFNPARGGCLYELDLRDIRHNLLATLARRPEAYHEAMRQGRVPCKHQGLDQLLHYDWHMRKSLVDHFYEPNANAGGVAAVHARELGDFVLGRYDFQVYRQGPTVQLKLSRTGQAAGQRVRITKEITLRPDADQLEVHYLLEDLPQHHRFHFAVEFNFAGMAAGVDNRYFYDAHRPRAGQLQTWQDLQNADRIGLVDEWLGLDASLHLSRSGGIWAFPIQTVSQSEGGAEAVHQSTAVLPHWQVEADSRGQWQVTIGLKLDVSRAFRKLKQAA